MWSVKLIFFNLFFQPTSSHLALLLLISSKDFSNLIHHSGVFLPTPESEAGLSRWAWRCHVGCEEQKKQVNKSSFLVSLCVFGRGSGLFDGVKFVRLWRSLFEGVILSARGITGKKTDQVWAWPISRGLIGLSGTRRGGEGGVWRCLTFVWAVFVLVDVWVVHACTEMTRTCYSPHTNTHTHSVRTGAISHSTDSHNEFLCSVQNLTFTQQHVKTKCLTV